MNLLDEKNALNGRWEFYPLQIEKREDGTYSVFNPMDNKTSKGYETYASALAFATRVSDNMHGFY